jgi:hypothetical protein
MSISSVSGSYNPYQSSQVNSTFQQTKTDFQNIGSALQSGNLSSAQSAFNGLQQLLQANQPAGSAASSTASSSSNPLSNDLASLGNALQSGNLNSAKAAYQKLQQDMQSTASTQHHHHHRSAGSVQTTAGSSTTAAAASGASTTGEASTINVVA